MSFEDLQKLRDLQARVGVLEEQVKQLKIAQQRTLTLPKESRNKVN